MSKKQKFKVGSRQQYRRKRTGLDKIFNEILEEFSSQQTSSNASERNQEITLAEQSQNNATASNERFNFRQNRDHDVDSFINRQKETNSLQQSLQNWAIKFNISHVAFSSLLKLLHNDNIDVPRDSRSVLNTPRKTNVIFMDDGQYLHIGLKKNLIHILSSLKNVPDTVHLNLNFDGLPISKSSRAQFWPILCLVTNIKHSKPFLIGCYYGLSKPINISKYLEQFVDEFLDIAHNNIIINGHIVVIKIRAIICDAPARSFITCTKGHNGYFGCSKCIQEGTYINHRMTFPDNKCELRNDLQFVQKTFEEHHTGISPLEKLNIGMVSCIPLDYMHMVCLGVMKKLMNLWIRGYQSTRFSAGVTDSLSKFFISYRAYVPREINRKPRSLNDYEMWKATEFRNFLLYFGLVLLHKDLNKENYMHFASLNCAMRILLDPQDYKKNNSYAKSLLEYFVSNFGVLYGKDQLIYNVHSS